MKQKKIKLNMLVLLMLFIGIGCHKDDIEYADESIKIPLSGAGISIYKTNGDYSDKLAVGLDSKGNISSVPLFDYDTLIVRKDKYGNFILLNRLFLKSEYILEDLSLNSAFTNITISEMVNTTTEKGGSYWNTNRYKERVIDKDPFTEYYFLDGRNKPEKVFTIGEINKMIENGTIETVFEKLK